MRRIARGDRVTRSKGDVVHVASAHDRSGRLFAICDTPIPSPTNDSRRLTGPECDACLAIAGAPR